jgi:voltage-gated potassium channel
VKRRPAIKSWIRPLHRSWRLFRRYVPRRIRVALLVPILFLVVGTVGYPLIEGRHWTWFDGLYMTGITLTTLGYAEVHPLSNPGRVFTLFLSYAGIFTLFYFATEIVRTVVTGELQELLGRERMEDELNTLDDHLIICGYGRMGKIVCDELEYQKKPFVAVDRQTARVLDWTYHHGVRLAGDATEDEVLRKAGVERAKALITVVGSDADNLYITLSARLMNPKLLIIARAEEAEAEAKLRKVGANKVISPYLAGGHRAVQAALRPAVLHFMEMATRSELMDLQIEEVKIDEGGECAGRTIRECGIHDRYGILVVGILKGNGDLTYNPSASTAIEVGDTLIVLGQRRKLDDFEAVAGFRP